MLGIGSATAYNYGLKATWFSPLPYAISFGALPWAIYLAAGKHPHVWLFAAFIIISVVFHFLNVIKDLEWDRSQLVRGAHTEGREQVESGFRVSLCSHCIRECIFHFLSRKI